ncbi:MAG: methyltransferase domain-containing protein [Chloroflexi bacterium]|nr:methyltransferase domain-containing protein [Chloroflexota bacterium]
MAHVQTYEQALDMDRLMSHEQFTNVLFPEIFTLVAPVGNELVLDVGTGTGHLAHALSHKITSGYIFGIDNSDAMLRVAKEKAVKENLNNYFPIKGTAENPLFCEHVFDLAFCVRALHHFAEPMKGLKEIKRVLKADGHLLLCEPVGPEDERLRELLTQTFSAAHPGHKLFSGEMIDDYAKSAGFQQVRGTDAVLAFHQEGLGGVPMGPHYMEAYHAIKMRKDAKLLDKFNEQVFQVTEGPGGKIHIHGNLTYIISYLEKKPPLRK